MMEYDEGRPHESPSDQTPVEYREQRTTHQETL